jgi:choline dehydrogenase
MTAAKRDASPESSPSNGWNAAPVKESTWSSSTIQAFDYVIVGAGTAGCLLANRLSADPTKRVLLLEAGGEDDWMWIHIPVGYLFCIGNARTDWCYKTEPERGLNGRSILYARGKTLGGCSSINAMIYMRGQSRDYDEWAALTGDARWSWQNVLPIFKATENHHAGESAIHGAAGAWRVEPQRLHWQILDTWRDAAAECGIAPTDDFNGGDNAGSARFEVNQRMGTRWNAAKAFLHPVRSRANLVVLTHAHASRVVVSNHANTTRADGVEFIHNNERFFARATREVILAGGAINSPQLLQLSGIGNPDHLHAMGIAPAHALAGVGENLQDHLQLRLAFKVHGVRTLNEWYHTWWGKVQMAMQFAFLRQGPLTMAPSQLGAFAKSDASRATANLQYHIQPLSLDKFGEPLHRFPAMTMSVCNLRPTSRGHVRLKSAHPMQAPAIQPNYLSTDDDKRVAIDALKLTRRIAAAPAMAKHRPEEFVPGPQYQRDEELITAAGNVGTTIFHPVGTCKMGLSSDATAVVDSELRVHGIANLRVIDASVMPTITSGNTNSPTLMIAERGAALVIAANQSAQ